MIVLAVDPGNKESAWLRYESSLRKIYGFGKAPNDEFIQCLAGPAGSELADHFAIEYMKPRGMPTSAEEMDTQFWAGMFTREWCREGRPWSKVHRNDIKMHLCGHTAKVRDSNIRRALIDEFGGESTAIGGKKCRKCKGKGWFGAGRLVCPECKGGKWLHPPGPLHGITDDVWSSLAIAVTWAENNNSSM